MLRNSSNQAEIIEGVANDQQAHFIDIFEVYGHDPKHFVDALHYSAAGIKSFAEILARERIELDPLGGIAEH